MYLRPLTARRGYVRTGIANTVDGTWFKTRKGFTNTYSKHMYSCNCDIFVCFRWYLFVRALFEQKLKLLQRKAVGTPSRSGRDPSSIERMAGAQSCFSAGVDKTISRGFCMRPYFIFIRTYDSSCFCKTAFFARSALGAQTTDTATTAAVQRTCCN